IDRQRKPKISDFGCSRGFGSEQSSSNIVRGIIAYNAPEVLRGELYTWAADIYSLGMIMWEISTNPTRRPFQGIGVNLAVLREAIIGRSSGETGGYSANSSILY